MRFLTPKDRDVIRKLLSLAGGDLGLVEKALRESGMPRNGIDLGAVANALRNQTPGSLRRRIA